MKKFGQMMLIVVAFGGLAAALSSVPSRPAAAAGSAPVTIVNTPLPVQGTVGVSNFPSTQNVAFASTPTVNANVTFPTSMNVANLATAPLFLANVDEAGRVPYRSQQTNTSCATGSNCLVDFGVVPAGKRLVVRHISINLFTSSPSAGAFILAAVLQTGTPVQTDSFTFPMLPAGGTGDVLGDQSVLIYLDAGENLEINLGPFNGSYTAAVSGYLLNCSIAPCASLASF